MKNVWMTLVLALAAWAIIIAAIVGITHLASAEPVVSRDPVQPARCLYDGDGTEADGGVFLLCHPLRVRSL